MFCINVSTLNMSPNAHCYNKEQSNIISVDKQRHLYKCQQWMNTSPITHFVVNVLLRHWLMMTSLMVDDVIIHIQRNCMCTFPVPFVDSEWKYKVEYFRATLNLIFDPKIFSKSVIFDIKIRKFYIPDIFRRKSIYENFIFSKIFKV